MKKPYFDIAQRNWIITFPNSLRTKCLIAGLEYEKMCREIRKQDEPFLRKSIDFLRRILNKIKV